MLLPFSLLYTFIVYIRFLSIRPKDLGLPVISVGNRVVGGSGKTPFTIELASKYDNAAVVLRGYGRKSKGLIVVQHANTLLVDVSISGDEAMVLANALPNCTIIVCENRLEGIEKAKALGCELVFLDDGYSKHTVKKFDILLEEINPSYLPLCLPSGALREPLWWGKKALQVYETKDFTRQVRIENSTQKMVLVTAISKPWRLDPFLPKVLAKEYFLDHSTFTKQQLEDVLQKHQATSILTTQKDSVKMQDFNLPLSIMRLTLSIDKEVTHKVNTYIETFRD